MFAWDAITLSTLFCGCLWRCNLARSVCVCMYSKDGLSVLNFVFSFFQCLQVQLKLTLLRFVLLVQQQLSFLHFVFACNLVRSLLCYFWRFNVARSVTCCDVVCSFVTLQLSAPFCVCLWHYSLARSVLCLLAQLQISELRFVLAWTATTWHALFCIC